MIKLYRLLQHKFQILLDNQDKYQRWVETEVEKWLESSPNRSRESVYREVAGLAGSGCYKIATTWVGNDYFTTFFYITTEDEWRKCCAYAEYQAKNYATESRKRKLQALVN